MLVQGSGGIVLLDSLRTLVNHTRQLATDRCVRARACVRACVPPLSVTNARLISLSTPKKKPASRWSTLRRRRMRRSTVPRHRHPDAPVARSLVAARCECALSKRRGLRDTVPESLLSWLGGRSERWLEKIGLAAEDGYECTPTTYTQNDGFAQV